MATTTVMVSSTQPENDVQTVLNFYLDPELGGTISSRPNTVGHYRRKFDRVPVTVHDIRGREGDFSVNREGFQLYKHSSVAKTFAAEDFGDRQKLKEIYYPETAEMVKKA